MRAVAICVLGLSLGLAGCVATAQTTEDRFVPPALVPPTVGAMPAVVTDAETYLPDFSYAGYRNGEATPQRFDGTVFNVADYGAVANDGLDDTQAVSRANAAAHAHDGPVVLRFPAGRFILSDILYIQRSDFALQGAGDGDLVGATTLYYPYPLRTLETPDAFAELSDYLIEFDKRQRETANNVDMPFSLYAWSGGFIWAQPAGHRGKAYLERYDDVKDPLTSVTRGTRESRIIDVADASGLVVGDVYKLEWYNRRGEFGPLLDAMYGDRARFKTLGSHHWNFPNRALVTQSMRVEDIDGNRITLSSPLMFDADPAYEPTLVPWTALENVHIGNFNVDFPNGIQMPHHVEDGFNALYLLGLYDSTVQNVTITNSDAGIITDDSGNLTIRNIHTRGDHRAHYTVHMGSVHNVLADGLTIDNVAQHPISFNTYAVRSVYRDVDLNAGVVLDQHSGANHQNLFDNIRVRVALNPDQDRIKLFDGGGAGYWKPSHGRYSTFYNIDVTVTGADNVDGPITLTGPKDGVEARLLQVHGNREFIIDYGPDPIIQGLNQPVDSPSLYDWQRANRGTE